MQSLQDQVMFKFHPNTMQFLREQYRLDKPGQMEEAVDLLDGWMKKQSHFTVTDYPRDYLERQIILNKGSIEKAKKQLEMLFTAKIVMPYVFTKFDAKNDFEDLHDVFISALLPQLTEDHYRVFIGKTLVESGTTRQYTLSYQFSHLLLEYIRANDYCNGFVGIMDYRSIKVVEFLAAIDVLQIRQFLYLLTEGYQTRLKAIHLLTESKAIVLLVNFTKQFVSPKIGNRIHVHKTIDSLHEHIPKKVLPKDYGGEEKPLDVLTKEWNDVLSTKENICYFKHMAKATVNEDQRCGGKLKMDDMLGISGSFRTLSVD